VGVDVADVSEEHAASIFRVGVCKVGKFVYIDLQDPVSNNRGEGGDFFGIGSYIYTETYPAYTFRP
jgi:hypothetical protein